MNCVLHLNGWPGSGKCTIGQILAERLNGRLLDNHALLNPAEALFERHDPLHVLLWQAVRQVTLDYAAKLPTDSAIILTDPLVIGSEVDLALFECFRSLAERRNAKLISVILDIDPEENVRRIQASGRSEQRKLTRPEVLRRMREQ